MRFQGTALAALLLFASTAAWAEDGDAARGTALYKQRCAVCHGLDGGGGQGPALQGVLGRKAGEVQFGYSRALRQSGLTWDVDTLERYLAKPQSTVPGTTMVVATANAKERADVIAFLATLKPVAAAAPTAPAAQSSAAPAQVGKLLEGRAAFGDFRADAPGVRRHITVDALPAPYETQSARNPSRVVEPAADAMPRVPDGFKIEKFAENLAAPRILRTAPNGDIFVAETAAGRVKILRGTGKAEKIEVFASGLEGPFGIAFYPASNPRFVYVAEVNRVVRFAYKEGDLKASGKPEIIVPQLSPTSGGHTTRDLVFSKDGTRMFVSVGSASNVSPGGDAKSGDALRAWEASRAIGAAYGDEEKRADVLVFDVDGKNGKIFAAGIRNCVGLAVHPSSGDVWCSTNERDGLGDDLVPDYVTRVKEGGFYGWPWFYLGAHEDPRHAGARPDLKDKITVPDVLLQSHSASLGMVFYDGASFPAAYRGDGFAALHGSWNRALRTGYKVIRVRTRDGVPTGEYEDFLTGLVINDREVWARPVGLTVAKDGSLLVSEDGNGTIWRVSYRGAAR
ncbi:PQQ-dependent sugar dehydrogenase [Roseiterribacter gracilis]|uniref:Sorbosone dehydrogenase n=1 Tax=Roseiterribacter gracilis TaxID=2812848 RepID=A0A8S8X7Z1_9PROT|nr:sorbosone dehydrogenase [Rhodospirillales bacterium TMPK1]